MSTLLSPSEHTLDESVQRVSIRELTDLTRVSSWYPLARQRRRRIVYHVGPTNSGKTHAAIEALRKAPTGIYCGPLRLLAHEVGDRLNEEHSVACDTVTGQSQVRVNGARHMSCTVEMCPTDRQFSVGVIDEIQLLASDDRGFAWTRALLGLAADEVHLCGNGAALPLVERICGEIGEQVDVRRYERLSPLDVDWRRGAVHSIADVRAGDAIVAFSRRDIFMIKQNIERETRHRCCVVFGALPPETRAQQAALFNDASSGHDVLVASDAIGMGLNLEIRRVVFSTLEKFDGVERRQLEDDEIKQIAGRAGRYASRYPRGLVSATDGDALPIIERALESEWCLKRKAGILPPFSRIERYLQLTDDDDAAAATTSFADAIELFHGALSTSDDYFACNIDDMIAVARLIEPVAELDLRTRYTFCTAPVKTESERVMLAALRFASDFACAGDVRLHFRADTFDADSRRVPSTSGALRELETDHAIVDMYRWLARHFPDRFVDKALANELAARCAELIDHAIVLMSDVNARAFLQTKRGRKQQNRRRIKQRRVRRRRPRRSDARGN
jgi:ATP-dependent RNA helicase SUPV3L1/SUV3